MKALELLKEYKVFFGASSQIPNKDIDEAIAELEEAIKPKSCESCKHHNKICTLLGVGDIGGCGDYWEAKDEDK